MDRKPLRAIGVALRRPHDAFELTFAADVRAPALPRIRVGHSFVPEAVQRFAGGARIVVADAALPPLARLLATGLAETSRRHGAAAAGGVSADRVRELFDAVGTADGDAAPLIRLLLAVARWTNGPDDERRRRRQDLARRVFAYIDAHFREPIRLREVARELGLAPAYLTDLVRRQTGQPVNQWIIERRLLEARRLLRTTDRAIAEIARDVGFEDGGYFARLFRRRSGRAPAAWRDERRARQEVLRVAPGPGDLEEALGAMLRATSLADVEDRAIAAVERFLGMQVANCARRDLTTGIWRTRRRFPVPCGDGEPVTDADQHMPLLLLGNAFVQDELADSFFTRMRALGRASNFGTFVAAPFFVDGECIGGVAGLDSESRTLSAEEIETFETIAACAALRLAQLAATSEERESA